MSNTWMGRSARRMLILAIVPLTAAATTATAGGRDGRGGICTRTAGLQKQACFAELADDYLTTQAACINDPENARDCLREARWAREEMQDECREQHEARREFCEEVGEAAYAPDLSPELFQDPRSPSRPNAWFPLEVGSHWVYEEDGERIEIEILDATKRVGEIDCIVYRDTVTSHGLLVEDTDDWFGLRTNGDVEYCGEEVKDYEYFGGDDPEEAELVSIEGRFKAGVELAKSGTAFLGTPVPGSHYRQEWDPGNAEDVGEVLSVDYAWGHDATLDELVPQALAELMCADGDCVVIADRSLLDPSAFERKYYARGVGKFLETKPEEGAFVPLVGCNVDPRCDALPIAGDE
ncbi:MAG: hypothetical protein R3E53_07260 [Myxococcota bacterium]